MTQLRRTAVGIGFIAMVGLLGFLALFILPRNAAYLGMRTSCPAVDRLRHADARVEALAALARGDRHLLMIGGYVGTIPGAKLSNLPSILVEGTGDDVKEECQRVRPYAERYATIYNQTIVSRVHR